MELSAECIAMLEVFKKPAFLSKDAVVIRANEMAQELGILADRPVTDYIDELDREDSIVSKRINDIYYTISSSNIGVWKLYVFEKTVEQNSVSSLLRAAQHLRIPISGINSSLTNIKALLSNEAIASHSHMQNATKQLFSLYRTVRNMSDIGMLLENNPTKKTSVSVCAFFQEIADKMATYLESSGVHITYTAPDIILYCLIDTTIMERALYNMVSNSLNAGSRNIHISLSKNKNSLQLTVTDDGCGISEKKKATLLNKFQSAPTLSYTEQGLGLGMLIIHTAAIKHNGTVMITNAHPKGCKVTLTFDVAKGPLTVKQKPHIITTDTTGGLDPVLIEFSDFLKPEDFL